MRCFASGRARRERKRSSAPAFSFHACEGRTNPHGHQGDAKMTPKDVLAFAKKNSAVMLDLKFMDFPGLWQHFSVPIGELEESSFEDGFGFDGSSIRGWQ